MFKGLTRALRFGTAWKAETPKVLESELKIGYPDGTFPATLLLPEGTSGPLPGWVTLHGITRSGRKHPTLVRFVRALAASGAAVLVPEVPEWREMYLAPSEASKTLHAAILALADRKETQPGRIGAMGFSFGAPQALLAGTDPTLIPHLRCVVSFGGYFDLERTVRFLFTGEHEWQGNVHRVEPDPYGRWIVGGNFLTRTEEYRDTGEVEGALLDLARSAGDIQVPSWDPIHDTLKLELEGALPEEHRELFRAFAPNAGVALDSSREEPLVRALAEAARGVSPLFDIGPCLKDIRVPVRLIHGRQDRLIPFTETLRLAERFPANSDVRVFLTGLFSHSQRDPDNPPANAIGEQLGFLRLMSVILGDM